MLVRVHFLHTRVDDAVTGVDGDNAANYCSTSSRLRCVRVARVRIEIISTHDSILTGGAVVLK
jgi:hypothetical protein